MACEGENARLVFCSITVYCLDIKYGKIKYADLLNCKSLLQICFCIGLLMLSRALFYARSFMVVYLKIKYIFLYYYIYIFIYIYLMEVMCLWCYAKVFFMWLITIYYFGHVKG